MNWEPGALLRLISPTRSFGRFPGDTLFLLLSKERAPVMLVLCPDGLNALIPSWCLVQVGSQGQAQERPGATQTGRVG